jgi:hypothetical protein
VCYPCFFHAPEAHYLQSGCAALSDSLWFFFIKVEQRKLCTGTSFPRAISEKQFPDIIGPGLHLNCAFNFYARVYRWRLFVFSPPRGAAVQKLIRSISFAASGSGIQRGPLFMTQPHKLIIALCVCVREGSLVRFNELNLIYVDIKWVCKTLSQ